MSKSGNQFAFSKLPKVELHVHLDGAVRHQTIWELAQKKGIHLAENLESLRDVCVTKCPSTLANFLKPIPQYLQVIAGDPDAIERIAYEFCEDAVKEGIVYCETRYSPHLMSSKYGFVPPGCSGTKVLDPRDVVKCINKGLERGSAEFGINIRSILCSIRGRSGWSDDIVALCYEFQDRGVVAMDIAGDDRGINSESQEDEDAFKLAASLGIHRTVHAGEDGPAAQVEFALDQLMAERIGHGYHVVDDPLLYARCLKSGVHFESCPNSSVLTGAVDVSTEKHPIVRFAEDGANFSINRDDPTLIHRTLDDDYELLRKMGLEDIHFINANLNAARSSFLPENEKEELIQRLTAAYGMYDNETSL